MAKSLFVCGWQTIAGFFNGEPSMECKNPAAPRPWAWADGNICCCQCTGWKPPREHGDISSATCVFTLPVAVERWLTLRGAFPLTEVQWARLLAILEAMKPALVVAE